MRSFRLAASLLALVALASLASAGAARQPKPKPKPKPPALAKGLKVTATLHVPGWLGMPTATPGAVWVPTTEHSGLVRIDTHTNAVTTPIAGTSNGAQHFDHFDQSLAAYGSVWIAGDYGQSLRRVDPATGKVAGTVALPYRPCQIAALGGKLWLCAGLSDNVSRWIPSPSPTSAASRSAPTATAGVAQRVGGDDTTGLWADDADGPSIKQIDTEHGTVLHTLPLTSSCPRRIGFLGAFFGAAVFGLLVWTLNQLRGTLFRDRPGEGGDRRADQAPVRRQRLRDRDRRRLGLGEIDDSYLLRISPQTNKVTGWVHFERSDTMNFTGVTWMDGAA